MGTTAVNREPETRRDYRGTARTYRTYGERNEASGPPFCLSCHFVFPAVLSFLPFCLSCHFVFPGCSFSGQ